MLRAGLIFLLGLMAIPATAQQIAITFDDLPAHGQLPPGETRLDVANSILTTLKTEHLPPVYGFINGVRTEETPASLAVLKAWRAAGEPLGNHTWSHPDIGDLTSAQFESEIEKNEPLLRSLMDSEDWHWFRYPSKTISGTTRMRGVWTSMTMLRSPSCTIAISRLQTSTSRSFARSRRWSTGAM